MTSFACTYLISAGKISSIVSMEPKEMAYFSPLTSTIRAWIIASVRGRRTINLEPSPSTLLTSTSPPSASILDFTTSRPTPRPDISEIFFAIEKLGIKRKSIISFWLKAAACSGVSRPRSIALFLTFSVSIPLPSSLTSMMTLLPSWKALR